MRKILSDFEGQVIFNKTMRKILSKRISESVSKNKNFEKQKALMRNYIYHEMRNTHEVYQCILMKSPDPDECQHISKFRDLTEAELHYNELYICEDEAVMMDNLGGAIISMINCVKSYLTERFPQKLFCVDISVSYFGWFKKIMKKGSVTAHFRIYRESEYPLPKASDLDKNIQPMLAIIFKT